MNVDNAKDKANSWIEKIKAEAVWVVNELKRIYTKGLWKLIKPKGVFDLLKKGMLIIVAIIFVDHLGNMATYTAHSLNRPKFVTENNLELVKRREGYEIDFIKTINNSAASYISDFQVYTTGGEELVETRYIIITPKGDGLADLFDSFENGEDFMQVKGHDISWPNYYGFLKEAAFMSGLEKGYIANFVVMMVNPYNPDDVEYFPYVDLAPNSFANIQTFGLQEGAISDPEKVQLLKNN